MSLSDTGKTFVGRRATRVRGIRFHGVALLFAFLQIIPILILIVIIIIVATSVSPSCPSSNLNVIVFGIFWFSLIKVG